MGEPTMQEINQRAAHIRAAAQGEILSRAIEAGQGIPPTPQGVPYGEGQMSPAEQAAYFRGKQDALGQADARIRDVASMMLQESMRGMARLREVFLLQCLPKLGDATIAWTGTHSPEMVTQAMAQAERMARFCYAGLESDPNKIPAAAPANPTWPMGRADVPPTIAPETPASSGGFR